MSEIMAPGLYCMDCMEAMKQFPDGYFDLAIVDPPYGDGNSKIGGGYALADGSTDTKRWNRFGQRFDRYKNIERGSTAKKLLRGTWPQGKNTLTSFSASHAIKSFGAEIISSFRRQGVFWCGES